MLVLNTTPHTINYVAADDTIEATPSCGESVRVVTEQAALGTFMGLSVYKDTVVSITYPDTVKAGDTVIVSRFVLDTIKQYPELAMKGVIHIAPDTGSTAIRNDKGHIVAVTQWITA